MSKPTKHLWEVGHSYYCNDGNYFTNESVCGEYTSWASFIAEYKDADMDMNLLFRWDWREGEDWDLEPFNGDINYRNGKLLIFWMGQRKGIYRCSSIEVCRADEDDVRAFLLPRWEHMKALWEPISSFNHTKAEGVLND